MQLEGERFFIHSLCHEFQSLQDAIRSGKLIAMKVENVRFQSLQDAIRRSNSVMTAGLVDEFQSLQDAIRRKLERSGINIQG